MEQITTRKASLADLETLLRFEQGIISAERPFDDTLKKDPLHYYELEQMITDPQVHLIVAESSGTLIGCGYARIQRSRSFLQHEYHGYLGFMYVDPAHRGKGVNQIVIQALEKWVSSQGLTELRLEVYCDNHSAIKAYEKVGFSKYMITMRKGIK